MGAARRIYLPDSCLREHKLIRMQNYPSPLCTITPDNERFCIHLVVQGNSNKQICRVLIVKERLKITSRPVSVN